MSARFVNVDRDTHPDHDIRRYDYRPPREQKERTITDPLMVAMREKVRSEEGRKIYRKRKQTVEPVFGIIKSILWTNSFAAGSRQ